MEKLKSFEIIDRSDRGKTSTIYFRFFDGSEQKITEKSFIENTKVRVSKGTIDKFTKHEHNNLKKQIIGDTLLTDGMRAQQIKNISTEEFKKQFRTTCQNQLQFQAKKIEGQKGFDKIVQDFLKSIREMYEKIEKR